MSRSLLHLGRTAAGEHTNRGQRVDAKDSPAYQRQHHGTNAYATAADGEATTAAASIATAVFHIVRLRLPSHFMVLTLCAVLPPPRVGWRY